MSNTSTERTAGEIAVKRDVEWLTDYFNPVLIKEVRQALRGKQFRSAFTFTLIVSLIVAVSIVLGNSGQAEWRPIGPLFFQGIFFCLTAAVIGFVPMASFTSMGAEWEENTYDLLILSHLRPRNIVLGKLLASGVQALLYFSIFSPYMVFTFLLGGVDLRLVLVAMPLLAIISLSLSAFAVGLSSMTQQRMARVVLMVVLAAVLVGAFSSTVALMIGALQIGVDFSSDEVQISLSAIALAAAIVGGFSFTIATARLAHPEENHSTGLRLLTFGLVLLCMSWGNWIYGMISRPETIAAVALGIMAGLGLLSIFFVTERERLGLRVGSHLPKSPLLRLFIYPWLPGGGRAAVWLFGLVGLTVLWANATIGSGGASFGIMGVGVSSRAFEAENIILAGAAYCLIYLLLPSVLFTNKTRELRRSTMGRAAIPMLFIGGILVPSILGFLLHKMEWVEGAHLGNPFMTIAQISDNTSTWEDPMGGLLTLAIIVLLLQLPRVIRGVLEVLRAVPHARTSIDEAPPGDA